MFTVDPNITDLRVKERNLFKVLFSMNIHQVATPELSVEDARSYVFFIREGSGRVLAYVGLYFVRTDRKMYYTHSSNPFPEGNLADIEGEARSFAEDLGAMLDELNISKMSVEEKNRWIDEQDIFSTKQKAAAEQPAPAAQPAQETQPAPAAPARPVPSAQPAPRIQKKAAPRPAAPEAPAEPAAAPSEQTGEVLEQAVKADAVKAPKAQAKKDTQGAAGVVSREREALARLLASF